MFDYTHIQLPSFIIKENVVQNYTLNRKVIHKCSISSITYIEVLNVLMIYTYIDIIVMVLHEKSLLSHLQKRFIADITLKN
jgi:uncharacterized protein YdeI (YjbR/CyaY-like superfamily)